jgi:dTDP-4-amino-4,6-dideoxygalactose transaminase
MNPQNHIPFCDLHAQYLSIKPEVDRAIADVIASCDFIRGSHVEAFELAWAQTLGVKRCVSCANGTDALYIAMRGLGVGSGDEVITTAHTWIASSETITQAGGRVVFCDTESDTFTIDPIQIASKITARTVGIIAVHLFGQACNMDAITALAQKHHLWVIEDCAQAHLARYKGKLVGTFGNAATFSFYPGKNLGAYGDAGCIVTNDTILAEWMSLFARHGGKGEHVMEGINSRMDGIQGAVLGAKLPHLPRWTAARQRIAALYNKLLSDTGDIATPYVRAQCEHVYHLYVIRTRFRDRIRQYLTNNGIATSLNYPKALPFYPAYAYLGAGPADFPVAFAHQSQILSLPIYPEMTDEMVSRVVAALKSAFHIKAA